MPVYSTTSYTESEVHTLKAKYFFADTLERAQALALEYFACETTQLTIEVVTEGGEEKNWELLVIDEEPRKTVNLKAFFTLYYEQDGVYLEVYPKRGIGEEFDSKVLSHHLGRKNISGLNIAAVQKVTEAGRGRSKIAPPQNEHIYGEDISVLITGDEREAMARLLAPEPGGASITPENAKQMLSKAGVVHGIDDNELKILLEAKVYNRQVTVAKATEPIDGEDGKLIFHFATDERTGRPREIGHGRVDYRSLDLYVPVTEGQLLVTKTGATEGTPGITVKGNPIKQKPGKETMLPRGKNITMNPEKTEMYSASSGMVDYINNSINVSNIYKVNGDCDMSVGNIDFDGSVHVTGSVRSGNTIKATDRITVEGGVEAATLIAKGNVEVKGGLQGSSKGRIESGGSVTVLYAERGTIVADGPVKLDVCIHSRVETGSTLHALGKRGAIIGGHVAATGDIVANYIGAISNTRTEIEVGFMPIKRTRIALIEKELERINADLVKLDQLDAYLEKSKGTMDQAMWEKLHISGVENRKINTDDKEAFKHELEQLKEELSHASESRVHAIHTAFAGSRITIGSSSYKVNDEIGFATFRVSSGEIVFGPCEYSDKSRT